MTKPQRDLPGPQNVPDHTSLDGATALAQRICAYWAERGWSVDIRLVTTSNGRSAIAHIRSDMVGGLPTRRTGTPGGLMR